MALDGQSLGKQKWFKRTDFNRELYLNSWRPDIKWCEGPGKGGRRGFANKTLHKNLSSQRIIQIFPVFWLPLLLRQLLDAFEEKFSENPEAGIDMLNSYCQRNIHQWLLDISSRRTKVPRYLGPMSNSVQRVPEPDPIPGISFATRPDPIQFWKSSGSG